MKKLLLVIAVVAMALSGCTKIEESIDALENRIDKLEQSIPTIDEQISSIQESINALEEVDSKLKESIKALEASDKATAEEIAALKDADKAIEAKIAELKKYVDDALKATKDWVSATFATLEQLNALSGEVAALKSLVDANKAEAAANLATAIANLETSLKAWVGEQLSNYYTIAEIDAKIAELQKAITDGDSALQQQLNDLKSQLETAKAELTDAYKKAIKEAIETNNGVINAKIAEEIGKVNELIEELNSKLAKLQIQVDKNTEDIAKLLARIQSVSYLPEYSDGVATVTRMAATSKVSLDFKISPKECVAELANVWQTAVSCEALYTKTRAASLVKMPATAFEVDAESGIITVTASGENLSEEFFAGTQEAKVALVISDGNNSVTSDYIPMVAKELNNQIWYKTTDGQPLTPNHEGVDIFGANIVSNTYNEESGWLVLEFDAPVTKIGEYAFGVKKAQRDEVDSTLKEIILPNSVTSIESWAFAWCCDNLTSISIPKSVASIGETVFGQCKSLETIDLKNITTIGNYIFYDCSGLKSVNLSTALTTIPLQAFYGCSSLTSIAIPASVTSIGEDAFTGCKALERVDITDLVAWCKIDLYHYLSSPMYHAKSAYLNGVEITDLVIPTEITEIKKCSFHSWEHITSVTLHNGITAIGYDAFASCDYLTSVTIPNSVTAITEGAFRGGTLSSFYGKFATEDNRSLVIDNTLIAVAPAGLTSYRIPNGITRIGDLVFKKTKINTVVVPNSVTSIGYQALEYISNTNIVIFEGTTPPSLGSSALSGIEGYLFVPAEAVDTYKSAWTKYADYIKPYEERMNVITYTTTDGKIVTPYSGEENEYRTIESLFGASLISNTYENGVGKMVFSGPVTLIGEYSFIGTNLKTIVLPNGIKNIGSHAFKNCTGLQSAKLPNNCTTIYQYAFEKCSSLVDITIPDSVTSLRNGVFLDCNTLESIAIPSGVETLSANLFQDCSKLKYVTLNEGLKAINEDCFQSCKKLDVITIPNSVEKITDAFAFALVQKFAGKFATEDGACLVVDGVLKKISKSITEYYTLPSTITTLGKSCFSSTGIGTPLHITIPDSVVEIERSAFGQTDNIGGFYGKYAADDHIAVIKDNVLHGVAGAALQKKYTVPEGVTKIATYAFDTVGGTIKEIVLPSTVVTIENYSLKTNGNGYTSLYCKAVVPPTIGKDIFNGLAGSKLPTIYVPRASVSAYKAAEGWKEFASKIVGYDF